MMEVLLGTSKQTALNPYPTVPPPSDPKVKSELVTSDPQWLVIEKVANLGSADVFSRDFLLQDHGNWTERVKDARQMLVLYERDPGEGDRFRGVIKFKDKDGKDAFWEVRDLRVTVADK